MKDLTNLIKDHLKPIKVLLFYKNVKDDTYVECFDMNERGMAVNAHPLSVSESQELADALDSSVDIKVDMLGRVDIFPDSLLYVSPERNGFAVWYTTPKKANLFFKAELGPSSGSAHIPALLWKANRNSMGVWALKDKDRPNGQTELCHAPFLNVYDSGSVCMGSVRVDISKNCSVAELIQKWEGYFFNSSFSHTISGSERLVPLWRSLIGTGVRFPNKTLNKTGRKLKDILT